MKQRSCSIPDLLAKKTEKKKITMLTAYDYQMACAVDACGADIVLVGDTLGMVCLGYEDTTAVTMGDMLHHTKAVRRGVKRALLVGDMPFMSYQASAGDALRNAGRFIQEAGCTAVKIEGGTEISQTIKRVVSQGIPVMGHIGLTPQKIHMYGGYKVQGKTVDQAIYLCDSARQLVDAGVFSIVLECVPKRLAEYITKMVPVPTLGIGASVMCDGQVLVTYDLLGVDAHVRPKFVKRYAEVSSIISSALGSFIDEVTSGKFPDERHAYTIRDDVWDKFLEAEGRAQNIPDLF